MEATVTISLTEYQNLLEFRKECKSKRVFLFDENLNIVYYTNKELNIIQSFNDETQRQNKQINKLIDQLFEIKYRSFKQKLKNLFK